MADGRGGAVNAIYNRYDAIGSAQIQVYGDGSHVYPGFVVAGTLPGGGGLNIYGYNVAPIIDAASSSDSIQITLGARVNLAGMKVQNSGSGNGVNAAGGAQVFVVNGLGPVWISGPCGGIKWQSKNSIILFGASYTDLGNAGAHYHIPTDGIILADGITVTASGTPAYSNYFLGMAAGFIEALGWSYSGSATGKKFYIHYNAAARFGAVGMEAALAVLPGSINGTVERGGMLDDYGKSPTRINKAVAKSTNFTLTLPYYCRIDSIEFVNATGNAVTGGINIGTTALGSDVLLAFPVAANSWTGASGATILKPRISSSADTTLYISAVTSWNAASVDVVVNFTDMKTI